MTKITRYLNSQEGSKYILSAADELLTSIKNKEYKYIVELQWRRNSIRFNRNDDKNNVSYVKSKLVHKHLMPIVSHCEILKKSLR